MLVQIEANNIPCIQVMNKIDLTSTKPRLDFADDGSVKRVWLSVETTDGVDLLKQALVDLFREQMVEGKLLLEPAAARLRAKLFEIGAIRNESIDDDGRFLLQLSISRRDLNQFESREQVSIESQLV